MKLEIMKHSPYSPEFTPSYFHALFSMKCNFGGKHFEMEEELKSAMKAFFQKQEAEWYYKGIQNWVKWHNKCLDSDGNYVEK